MKKRSIAVVVAIMATTFSFAQTIFDGLRYSQNELLGTARYQAMSGAFGALGGDLTALSDNPAGSAIYNSSSGAISLGLTDTENTASYFNTNTSSFDTDVSLQQGGIIYVVPNFDEESPWRKITLGINLSLIHI